MHIILQIGAGHVLSGDSLQYESADAFTVLEAHPVLAQQLREKIGHASNVTIIEAGITEDVQKNQLKDYSFPGFSSLKKATGLYDLFPGLRLKNQYAVSTLTPFQVLTQFGPTENQTASLLICAPGVESEFIECLVASPIRSKFTRIVINTGIQPLYEGDLSVEEMLSLLQSHGYDLVQRKSVSPEWVQLEWQRNVMYDQMDQLEQQLAEKDQALAEALQACDTYQLQLQQLQQELSYLKSKDSRALEMLESRMEQLFKQQGQQIQQATNSLGQHVSQSFQEQRQHQQAITGLYQYLENGEQPLPFTDWSIGVDLAGHLIRAIEQNNYDLIIEFGSGTSTSVMAKAIANTQSPTATYVNGKKAVGYEDIVSTSRKEVAQSQAASLVETGYELPRRLLSFEQDKRHLHNTETALKSQGLSHLVELVLAPLVKAPHSSQAAAQRPLFYDCEKALARIAQLYENRTARILVLIDGPFSPKNNPLIREPALATLLQYLSAHHLDVVLDDAKQKGEQDVLRSWKELCEERGLAWQQTDLETEKGACWVKIAP